MREDIWQAVEPDSTSNGKRSTVAVLFAPTPHACGTEPTPQYERAGCVHSSWSRTKTTTNVERHGQWLLHPVVSTHPSSPPARPSYASVDIIHALPQALFHYPNPGTALLVRLFCCLSGTRNPYLVRGC